MTSYFINGTKGVVTIKISTLQHFSKFPLSFNLIVTFYCFLKRNQFSNNYILIKLLGLSFCFIGLLIRVWAIKTLKNFFSWKINIQKEHKLIKNGPYSLLRHPSYSGGILAVFGFNLSLGVYAGIFSFLITYIPILLMRVFSEEKVLINYFRTEYENYKKRTYALIPFVF